MRCLTPGIGMDLTHEPVADHSDPECFCHNQVEVELIVAVFIVAAKFQVNG